MWLAVDNAAGLAVFIRLGASASASSLIGPCGIHLLTGQQEVTGVQPAKDFGPLLSTPWKWRVRCSSQCVVAGNPGQLEMGLPNNDVLTGTTKETQR